MIEWNANNYLSMPLLSSESRSECDVDGDKDSGVSRGDLLVCDGAPLVYIVVLLSLLSDDTKDGSSEMASNQHALANRTISAVI
jgi:hypothetical protein